MRAGHQSRAIDSGAASAAMTMGYGVAITRVTLGNMRAGRGFHLRDVLGGGEDVLYIYMRVRRYACMYT